MTDLERVAARWDATEWSQGIPEDYWSHHPLIDAYIHATVAPRAEHILDWFAKNFLKDGPRERALSVGCGLGVGDRQALLAGVCRYLEGFDISPASIRAAQAEADKAGLGDRVHYWIGDANTISLEQGRYDVAIALGALHHVEKLEHLCQQLQHALKPGSYIFINEFVGPARHQWTRQQLDIINRVTAVLPAGWRRTQWVEPPPVDKVTAADPSEAVRSDEVVSALCGYFELVDYCDYGGGLLMPLWEYAMIPKVFMQDNRVDKQVIIKLLILIDELLAEHAIVPSNCAQLVLRNRYPLSSQATPKRLSVQSPDRHRWVKEWLPGTDFGSSINSTTPGPSPTPWWQLPGKALRILTENGPRAMVDSVQAYVRWLTVRR